MSALLSCQDLSKSFGGLRAVERINLDVYPNQIVSVIGPNGAGKTTLFNCLSGIYRPDEGRIFIGSDELTHRPPHAICRRGLARTFQNIRLFGEMSALENVMAGMFARSEIRPWHLLTRSARYQAVEATARAEALELLALVGLESHKNTWARNLAYGLQRRLEIARALATRPRVLLLDEPAAGMNPQEIGNMISLISSLKTRGFAILLIEHHMKLVMDISDRIHVLDHGVEIASGPPAEIRAHPDVIAAYLGRETTSTLP